jgi:hypothetical protein
MEIPMLSKEEWELIEPLLQNAISDLQTYRIKHGVSLKEARDNSFGEGALIKYRELTGFDETNANAIWHHRASLYGAPCKTCGKPLRTPKASFCAACGTVVA